MYKILRCSRLIRNLFACQCEDFLIPSAQWGRTSAELLLCILGVIWVMVSLVDLYNVADIQASRDTAVSQPRDMLVTS